jgi:hypothetical protein
MHPLVNSGQVYAVFPRRQKRFARLTKPSQTILASPDQTSRIEAQPSCPRLEPAAPPDLAALAAPFHDPSGLLQALPRLPSTPRPARPTIQAPPGPSCQPVLALQALPIAPYRPRRPPCCGRPASPRLPCRRLTILTRPRGARPTHHPEPAFPSLSCQGSHADQSNLAPPISPGRTLRAKPERTRPSLASSPTLLWATGHHADHTNPANHSVHSVLAVQAKPARIVPRRALPMPNRSWPSWPNRTHHAPTCPARPFHNVRCRPQLT